MPDQKLSVFVSYSHDDDPRWLKRVQVYLKHLVRTGKLELWDDLRIKAGDRWQEEIRDALDRAKVAVLLISGDFYASDFIAQNELPPLLEAERARGLRILGVHISYSPFDSDKILSEYQSINSPDRPVEALLTKAEQDKVFDDLRRRIEELLEPPLWLSLAPGAAEGGRIPGRRYGETRYCRRTTWSVLRTWTPSKLSSLARTVEASAS